MSYLNFLHLKENLRNTVTVDLDLNSVLLIHHPQILSYTDSPVMDR